MSLYFQVPYINTPLDRLYNIFQDEVGGFCLLLTYFFGIIIITSYYNNHNNHNDVNVILIMIIGNSLMCNLDCHGMWLHNDVLLVASSYHG